MSSIEVSPEFEMYLIERNIKEYLKDETDIIPTKEEITNYVSDVDKVRQKLDLLTAKLNKIKSK